MSTNSNIEPENDGEKAAGQRNTKGKGATEI